MDIYGIRKTDYGIRHWSSYEQPYQFNITVNEMRDVKRHADVGFAKTPLFDIQSSCDGNFRERL